MLKIVLPILIGVIVLGLFGFENLAFADSFIASPGGGDWNTGSTWIGGLIPGDSDDKIIPSGTTVMITTTVTNMGSVSNSGHITISNTGDFSTGITNTGTFTNNSTITVSNNGIGSTGISNTGTFTNNGTITVSNNGIGSTGISNTGTFTNNGTITVSNTGYSSRGIKNIGTITNETTNPGTITNEGTITISNTGDLSTGIANTGTITNNGAISISTIEGRGIHNDNSATFTNAAITNNGTITVSNNGIASTGIRNSGSFTNNFSGVITIENTEGSGISNCCDSGIGGTINNSGTITILSATTGITNGTITNSGIITVSNSGAWGIYNGGPDIITNNSGGLIAISNTGGQGIKLNGSIMTNNSGGTITISDAFSGISIRGFFQVCTDPGCIGILENYGTITTSSTFGLVVGSYGTLNNYFGGVINATNEKQSLASAGTINNYFGGVINATTDDVIDNGSPSTFNNHCRATYNGPPPSGNPIIETCVPCVPPDLGDWTIDSSCQLDTSANVIGSVTVENFSILIIPNGKTLDIDFLNFNLTIRSDNAVFVESGGIIT